MSPERARTNIEVLLARPNVVAPGELDGFWERFRDVASEADARGNLVTDAHVVALDDPARCPHDLVEQP